LELEGSAMGKATAPQDIQTLRKTIERLSGESERIRRELDQARARLADAERRERELKSQIATLLDDVVKSQLPDPAQEFGAAYPDLHVDAKLLALVGSQPARTIEQDKEDLRDILSEKHS
jgi:hypothetical protein